MKYVAAILAVGFLAFLFWLGGYDFNKRGEVPVMLAILGAYAFGAILFLWKKP